MIKNEIDVLSSFGLTPQSKILDIGCGDGEHCLELKSRGFKNVVGLDRSLNFSRSGNFILGDWNYLPFANGTFDFLYAFSAFDIRDKDLIEIGRVLKLSGKFIFDTQIWEELIKEHQPEGKILSGKRIIDVSDDEDEATVQFDSELDPITKTRSESVRVLKARKIIQSIDHGPIKVMTLEDYCTELAKFGFLISNVETIHPEFEINMLSPRTFISAVRK